MLRPAFFGPEQGSSILPAAKNFFSPELPWPVGAMLAVTGQGGFSPSGFTGRSTGYQAVSLPAEEVLDVKRACS
jgi:hypothetical protein